MVQPFDRRSSPLGLWQPIQVTAAELRQFDVGELADDAARAVADQRIGRISLSGQRGPGLGVSLTRMVHPGAHETLEVLILGHGELLRRDASPSNATSWLRPVPRPRRVPSFAPPRPWGPLGGWAAAGPPPTHLSSA